MENCTTATDIGYELWEMGYGLRAMSYRLWWKPIAKFPVIIKINFRNHWKLLGRMQLSQVRLTIIVRGSFLQTCRCYLQLFIPYIFSPEDLSMQGCNSFIKACDRLLPC